METHNYNYCYPGVPLNMGNASGCARCANPRDIKMEIVADVSEGKQVAESAVDQLYLISIHWKF